MKTGFSFGLTSAVITTLGLMVGLNAGTHSKLVVIGGILTIAIADAFSDSLGIHLSEEYKKISQKGVWEATVYTFLTKFFFALIFVIPVLFLELSYAIFVSIIWGMILLSVMSYVIAKNGNEKAWKVITEHLVIASIVIIITNYVGSMVGTIFV